VAAEVPLVPSASGEAHPLDGKETLLLTAPRARVAIHAVDSSSVAGPRIVRGLAGDERIPTSRSYVLTHPGQ
jgi:hypothetical protein